MATSSAAALPTLIETPSKLLKDIYQNVDGHLHCPICPGNPNIGQELAFNGLVHAINYHATPWEEAIKTQLGARRKRKNQAGLRSTQNQQRARLAKIEDAIKRFGTRNAARVSLVSDSDAEDDEPVVSSPSSSSRLHLGSMVASSSSSSRLHPQSAVAVSIRSQLSTALASAKWQTTLVDMFPTGNQTNKRTQFDLAIANLVVAENLPLRIVESPALHAAFRAASGVKLDHSDGLMSRTTLLEKHIKGANGHGSSLVALAVKRAESILCTRNTTLLTASIDSSRNIKREDVNVIDISGTSGSFPFGAFLLGTAKHTGENIAEKIIAMLSGVGSKNTPLSAYQREMAPYIALFSSDHAPNIQNALKRVENELGILLAGDGAHAMARLMERIFKPFSIAVPNMLELNNFLRTHKFFFEYFLEKKEISLVQESGTRFANILLILARIKRLEDEIRDRFNTSSFEREFKPYISPEDQVLAMKLKGFVNDDNFFKYAELLIALGTPILRALRIFDAQLPGNVCDVYKIWRLMQGNLTKDIATSNRNELMPKEIWDKIVQSIQDAWRRFHRPIYSAGYFLSPANQAMFSSDSTTEIKNEMKGVFDDTVHCLCTMNRRFDRMTGMTRCKILEIGGEEDVEFEAVAKNELRDYRRREGIFSGIEYTDKVAPSTWGGGE